MCYVARKTHVYKRASNENIINQGLFYLDWLMDHKRDFEWLVLKRFGQEQPRGDGRYGEQP
ncbi:hypothetical protein J2S88_003673 [Agrobacterium tumefaciens]|jgi:hypothetical protein|nr:hypothetical protein [Agrobacterium radiobacter]MBB4453495.1 hypothetical protein [Agrobacterium radiobacter]MDP9873934.1 hypothetical protein [Agrobacterium tumefaciens]MDP9979019.1 hypothetical protein [Agrobacterium tumefaciens]